jgi:hypothetical protein
MSPHPWLDGSVLQPVFDGWNEAAIFHDVIFGDVSNVNLLAVRIDDDMPEHLFSNVATKGAVQNGAVSGVSPCSLGRIEPVVNGEVIFDLSAVTLDRVLCVDAGLNLRFSS